MLASAFIVQVWYSKPESTKAPDEVQSMLHTLENSCLFAEQMYSTIWCQPVFKLNIAPDCEKNDTYQPPYYLSPNEDTERIPQLGNALHDVWIMPCSHHNCSPMSFVSKNGVRMHQCINYWAFNCITSGD